MLEIWIEITCDGCGDVVNSEAPNQTRAEYRREIQTAYGWRSYPGNLDYCRQCVKNGNAAKRVTGMNG